MIGEAVIRGVTEISNARMRREYPLLDKHYCEEEVRIVCESYYDLSKLILRQTLDNQLAKSKMVEAEFGNMITDKGE